MSLSILGYVIELELYTRRRSALPAALWLRLGERSWWLERDGKRLGD